MASQQDIRRRIQSVQSTKKITKAMEMVAAARLRRAQQRTEAARPYTENMLEFIGGMARYLQSDVSGSPLILQHAEVNTVAIVLITADRGMCGAFNSNVVRRAVEHVREYEAQGKNTYLVPVGRKGINTLRFQGFTLYNTYADITDQTAFLESQALARRACARYVSGEIDRMHLIYNRFKSAMDQTVVDQVILPVQEELAPAYTVQGAPHYMDFIYEPSESQILNDLIPAYVEMTVFGAMLDSMAGEHGARMTAMRNASDAASEMIDDLTLAMNRVRQASITNEILEVVAGADALAG
ncbi:MAG: ATP synthase F1 subunit gamma [Thermoleophilia bacterium]|jgi:F-type H+-transporting ATPase subunit gamma